MEGAHEKGGVEGEVGRFRRTHLVPVPKVRQPGRAERADPRGSTAPTAPGGSATAAYRGRRLRAEQPLLRPLPAEPFDTALMLTPRVDRYAQVMVRHARYSVPARLIARRVRVELSASELVIFDGGRPVGPA